MADVVNLQESPPDVNGKKIRYLQYRCPGCKGWHQVILRDPCPGAGRPSWLWNGDFEKPTLEPSILQYTTRPRSSGGPEGVQGDTDERVTLCHHFVRNGQIQYLSDCPHEMKGQTIDMVPWSTMEEALEELRNEERKI